MEFFALKLYLKKLYYTALELIFQKILIYRQTEDEQITPYIVYPVGQVLGIPQFPYDRSKFKQNLILH